MTDRLLPDIIQPEGLLVAEKYLECGSDSKKTSQLLGLPIEQVEAQLKKTEVRTFINRRFNEYGFRNKDRFFGLLDQIINLKIDEMDESQIGSSMDIMDIMKLAHKFKMDEMKAEADMQKASIAAGPSKQVNVQNNFGNLPGGDDDNYMSLINALVG